MVDRRRQPLVQVALLVVNQDLQGQGERDQARGKQQPAAETRVEVPDQPDGEDKRERKYEVTDIDVTSDPVNRHRSPFVQSAPQRLRLRPERIVYPVRNNAPLLCSGAIRF